MKNSISILILLASFTCLPSCGGSIESDGQKLAELTCKSLQKIGKMDEHSLSDAMEIASEIEELNKKFDKKYPTESEKEELQKAYSKALLQLGCE